jgi:hypothetical protein
VTGIAGGAIEPWSPGAAAVVQAPTGLLAHAMLGIADLFSRLPVEVDGRAAAALLAGSALACAARLWSGRRHNLRVDAVPSR